jgi:mono/diheme cytochrome c family protein
MCHGKEGNGKGKVAIEMKLKMNDETDPATLKDRTDGELFYIIKKGKDQMPPEGDRVKDETVWDMVNYVRSFAKKTDKPAEEKAPY